MKKLEKLFDILGEILAVLLVVVTALWIIDSNFHFLPGWFQGIVNVVKEYGAIALIGIVGLEAISKRNIIFRVIFYAMLALIVIFLFFPGTYQSLLGLIS